MGIGPAECHLHHHRACVRPVTLGDGVKDRAGAASSDYATGRLTRRCGLLTKELTRMRLYLATPGPEPEPLNRSGTRQHEVFVSRRHAPEAL